MHLLECVFWGFWLDGVLHMHVALMFGASLATEVFTRIMAVLYTLLRMLRPPLTYRLDDSKRRALRALILASASLSLHRRLMYCLGLVVGPEKSLPSPSQLVKYLDFLGVGPGAAALGQS
jgi:hypothetical protein